MKCWGSDSIKKAKGKMKKAGIGRISKNKAIGATAKLRDCKMSLTPCFSGVLSETLGFLTALAVSKTDKALKRF
jgi:hypothetical protein